MSTGELLTSWAGRVNGAVRALEVHENSLYVGGTFLNASGVDGLSQQRLRMAKFDVETGDLDATFHPNFSGGVKAIDIEGPTSTWAEASAPSPAPSTRTSSS